MHVQLDTQLCQQQICIYIKKIIIFRKSVNKGIAINTVHYLNDGLWKCQALN